MNRYIFFTPLLICSYCILYFFLGSKISVGNGFGYDGVLYAHLAGDFFNYLHVYGIDYYHATRIFPSFLIYIVSQLTGISLNTPARIINAFCVYNAILLTLSAWIWCLITRQMKFSEKIFWFGFISLFINGVVLWLLQFYPVLTDTTAIFFSLLLLYFYLTDKPLSMCIVGLFAAFTWPTALYLLLPLLLKQRAQKFSHGSILDIYFSFFVLMIYLGCVVYFAFYSPESKILPLTKKMIRVLPHETWFPLSLFLGGVYVFLVMKYSQLMSNTVGWVKLQSWRENYSRGLYLLSTLLIFYVLSYYVKQNYGHPIYWGINSFLNVTTLRSVYKPAIFLVSQMVCWGAIIAALAFFCKSVFRVVLEKHGYGLYLFFIVSLAQAMNCESRMLCLSLPMFVFITCLTLAEKNISWKFIFGYLMLNLFLLYKVELGYFGYLINNPAYFNLVWLTIIVFVVMGYLCYRIERSVVPAEILQSS